MVNQIALFSKVKRKNSAVFIIKYLDKYCIFRYVASKNWFFIFTFRDLPLVSEHMALPN